MDSHTSDMAPGPLSQGHFDQNSPLSLYSKMGPAWAKRFMDRLGEVPEIANCLTDETVLKEELERLYHYRPNPVDERYRLQLWLEYENACKLGRLMQMSNVYNLVGPESTFHNQVMKVPQRVAWMMCKPIGYSTLTREMLNLGLRRLQSYLDKDAWTAGKGGKPDMKLMKLQLEITKMVDLRQHGAPTQKIQSIELKGTIGANGEIQAIAEQGDMKALEQKKYDLELRRRAAEGRRAPAATPIDVEVVKEDANESSAGDSSGTE